MTLHTGRHFLQIPGPTNVPDRVLRAMDMPTMDHRGAEFAEVGFAALAGMQRVFRTKQPVIIFPSSGTGAWEAAIVNTLSPGDKVLMAETGQFAVLWRGIADKFKLDVDFLPGDWRRGGPWWACPWPATPGRVCWSVLESGENAFQCAARS